MSTITYYDDWDSLIRAVNDKTQKILQTDVAPVAEKILKKHIKLDIYNAYTPKHNGWVTGDGHRTTYQRRHELENNISSYMLNNDTLIITSTATASPSVVKGYSFRNRYPGAFLKMLEVGNTGIWKGGFPRPAVKNAQNEIDSSKKITDAIAKGIRREIGICVEESI